MFLNDAGNQSDWGFSTEKRAGDAQSVVVPAVDLADFMVSLNQFSPAGVRLMKMDIEGSEYDVLAEFLSRSLLCRSKLSKLTIEWHPLSWLPQHSQSHVKSVRHRVEAGEGCLLAGPEKTEVATLDDESYLNDGWPLP